MNSRLLLLLLLLVVLLVVVVEGISGQKHWGCFQLLSCPGTTR